MESDKLKNQLEKLYNFIFVRKHSNLVNRVEVVKIIQPNKDMDRTWWSVQVALYVTEEVKKELYEIYLRLQGDRDKVSYETFLEKSRLKNIFIDDILGVDVYDDLTKISKYVESEIYLIHPIRIL